MMRKRYASLIGALGALLILSGSAEAGWWDRLNNWLDDLNRRHDPREFQRQLNYNATANCIKYFERGEIDRAKLYCIVAANKNEEALFYAAVAEYKYKYGNKGLAYRYLKGAEKYLLEKIEKDDEQTKIEDKKKLAVVYLWLGEINKETYEKQKGDLAENFGKEAYETAIDYFKKALSLTEELREKGDSYIITRAGMMLASLYIDKSRYSYSLVEEAEKNLKKALSALEKAKPSPLFSKKEIQWTEMDIYNLLGIVQMEKIAFKKATEEDERKGIEYLTKAIDMAKRISPDDLASLKHNLGVLYFAMKDYDKYAKYTEEAIEFEKKKEPKMDLRKLAEWYEELADIYVEHLNNKKRAIECYDAAALIYHNLAKAEEMKGGRSDEIKRIEYERKERKLRNKIKKLYEELGAK
jgi:tetratricopeptide (TPR) repeat protein